MTENTKPSKGNLNLLVSRTIPEGENNIKFDHNSLKIYMLIEDGSNLLDIYKKTKLDKVSFVEAIKKLFKQGLIFRVPAEQFFSREKMEKIKSALAVYVGPVAQVIVADAFTSLGFSNGRLPVNKIDQLIEEIADQVPFNKALEFRKNIEHILDSSP